MAGPIDAEATPLTTIPPERRTDPHAILNQCRDVRQGITRVESYIDKIEALHKRLLLEADIARENEVKATAENLEEETKHEYRALIERMRVVKGTPGAGEQSNARHIAQVEGQLKRVIESYQKMQQEYRNGIKGQVERQYRIVRPEASDAEVQEAVESAGDQQIFSDALINSDRRGDAQKVSALVRQRHDDLAKIERDFIELSEMFTDLNNMVIEQEAAVEKIDEANMGVVDDLKHTNQTLDQGIDLAKKRNRKKWYCVLVIILTIIVIIIIVVVVVEVTKSHGGNKKLKF
ncbi:Plasma membrane t-SNARE, secretory vesicle fusion [Ascosphaera atra]|nr:Plasma membrane t-SNARE, secretory vesicle fusion [Ascosphaera atra]